MSFASHFLTCLGHQIHNWLEIRINTPVFWSLSIICPYQCPPLQVLASAQGARVNSNNELAALNERMQEYVMEVDKERKRSFSRPSEPQNVDATQPVFRNSQKMIEAVMHSAAGGKVHLIMVIEFFPTIFISLAQLLLVLLGCSLYFSSLGTNHQTRISFKTFLQFER